jgi:hypothetical protein
MKRYQINDEHIATPSRDLLKNKHAVVLSNPLINPFFHPLITQSPNIFLLILYFSPKMTNHVEVGK